MLVELHVIYSNYPGIIVDANVGLRLSKMLLDSYGEALVYALTTLIRGVELVLQI